MGTGAGVRPVEEPKTVQLADDPMSDSRTTHPAFAQIRANRYSGSHAMYGSSFLHSGGVSITISRSELLRGLSNDHHHEREELIEVSLTEAQWATFVSTLNNGSGIPCTLRHIGRETVPGLPDPPDMSGQYAAEMSETVREIQVALRNLAANEKLPQWARKQIDMQAARLTSSTGFIAKQFGEHVENVVEAAKIEINAYVTQTVHRAGLEHIASGAPISLPAPKGGK